MRNKSITASDCGCTLGENKHEPVFNFIIKKVFGSTFGTNVFCYHGKKFENVVTFMYSLINDVNVQDRHLNKLIHYAAVCESSGPLKLVIEKGASVFDLNGQKKSALHFAAINCRAENVRAILEANVLVWKLRDKTNKTAFAYACEYGDIETIKAFLDSSQGKIKINTGQGIDRMSPLMYAAAAGNYDLAVFLLD